MVTKSDLWGGGGQETVYHMFRKRWGEGVGIRQSWCPLHAGSGLSPPCVNATEWYPEGICALAKSFSKNPKLQVNYINR